jgi:hypothetical protein
VARFAPSRHGTPAWWTAEALRDLGADPALLHYDLPEEIA